MQILLTVAYDGTNYAGWQRQKNGVAVQERIEDALAELLRAPVTLRAASRTDAGVHALGQRAAFFAENLRVPPEKIPYVLNALLPEDISVTAAQTVPDDFHPQFHAKRKTYVYSVFAADFPNPVLRRYSAFVPRQLDVSAMRAAAAHFVGTHDFAAFCAAGGSAKTSTREIFACDVFARPDGTVSLSVSGGGFLYNMVRIIAGTVVYAGLGKIPPAAIPQIIASKDRTRAGKTMPPQGLTLVAVEY